MAAAPPSISYPPLPPVHSTWTFTQGLVFGQASFVALVLLFIRYVVFQRVEEPDEAAWRARREARSKQPILSTQPPIPPSPASLLLKTAYEMSSHGPESTDWLNVVLAQILQGYRNDLLSHGGEEGARVRIEKWLNPEGKKSSWLDPIKVTSLSLGRGFPLLSHARVRPADGKGAVVSSEWVLEAGDGFEEDAYRGYAVQYDREVYRELVADVKSAWELLERTS